MIHEPCFCMNVQLKKILVFFKIIISDDNLVKICYNAEKVKIIKVTYKSKRKKVNR